MTPEEKEAIQCFLAGTDPLQPHGQAGKMARAALKFAAALLIAGVAIAVGDGNEFDDVDCGVAAKPPGKAESAKSKNRESPGGRPQQSSGHAPGADGEPPGKAEIGNAENSETGDGKEALGAGEVVKMLKGIREEIAAVRSERVELVRENGDLRSAKERLEGMLADGLFGFTRRVDARSFKILCAILAEGDVAKASRALEMPDASVRTLMRRWHGMGKEYRAMADLVRWRKAVGRRETVSLNENVLLEKAARVDYPGLLAEVLDGLLSMTEENWEERCEELADLLRAVADG